jgi:ketosteroid isomerase-like protein
MAHGEVLNRFYRAFQQRDGEAMATCYHADATFRDPVFELRGARIGAMWKMLTGRGADLRVEYGNIAIADDAASADSQAWYTFSATGRRVHNTIHSTFRFADGLIVAQIDTFDFWRWSRQALGPAGRLLGWSPLLRGKVQSQARKALDRFISS